MIISHKYKYLFIEIPHTASRSIQHELCQYYAGEPILHRHAAYPEFRKIARQEELAFFVFAAVRNPMDEVVSRYHKLITNHNTLFTSPHALRGLQVEPLDWKRYKTIHSTGGQFQDYFKKYFRYPYAGMLDLSAADLDFVVYFEHLQHDFAQLLEKLKIQQERLLPITNITKRRKRDWREYYTPEIIPQAKRVFGPFVQTWGYAFPEDWGRHQISPIDMLQYKAICWIRHFYYVYFRYRDHPFARFMRSMRSRVSR